VEDAQQVTSLVDRFRLDGRVAIVTGASAGLGRQIAIGLGQAGAAVVLAARRAEALGETAELVRATGARAAEVPCDITSPPDCDRLAAAAVDTFGRLDILVNNAGIGHAVPATREAPEQFEQVMSVNVLGAYWMAQACARRMGSGASIVNIGSVLGLTTAGLPQAAYTASKAALIGLTLDLAQQWTGRKGIRVNTIAAGFFDSGMALEHADGYLDEIVARRIPAGRLGQPEELAAVVVFLAGDAASYVSGSVLSVDGGLLVT